MRLCLKFFSAEPLYTKTNVSVLQALHSVGNTKTSHACWSGVYASACVEVFLNLWYVALTPVHLDNHFGCANISSSLNLCPTSRRPPTFPKVATPARKHPPVFHLRAVTSAAIKIQQNHWKQLESRPGCHLPDMWQPPLASAPQLLVSLMVIKLSIFRMRLWQ